MAQDAGAESSAEEDQVDQQRAARHRQSQMLDALRGDAPTVTAKAIAPGGPASAVNDTNQQMYNNHKFKHQEHQERQVK